MYTVYSELTFLKYFHQSRREYNIRMDLRKIVREVVDWRHLDQDTDHWWALVNTVMNLWLPQHSKNLTGLKAINFSGFSSKELVSQSVSQLVNITPYPRSFDWLIKEFYCESTKYDDHFELHRKTHVHALGGTRNRSV
jgi:hypothetical protein